MQHASILQVDQQSGGDRFGTPVRLLLCGGGGALRFMVWVVVFFLLISNEDHGRTRKDKAAHNFVTIRQFVLYPLRRNPETTHRSIKRRRRSDGMEELCASS